MKRTAGDEGVDPGKVVGIIGGFGGMGRLFSAVFERAGYEVLCSGRKTPVSNEDIALTCDIVIVSVPIRDTVRVIGEIAPLLSEEQVLCDLTSIKTAPVEAMLRSKAQVIGLHPMFGPSVSTFAG
ncbi:MAG TPA: prephenate dehydrogenase/arogenate dehydrogenase family protein, partial [Methanocorpusculum sp.]|nr:prephenate dehydrogenase/arogenate dehydrogenase family protein [Methanocorpusculum sp.]